MKSISIRQLAAVKRVAQNVNLAVTRKNKVAEQIRKLNDEYNALVDEIEGHEAGIRALTGHTSEELVVRTVKDTGKVDKDGRPVRSTYYEIIPTSLKFNQTTKMYDIILDEPEIEQNPVNPEDIDGEAKVEMKEQAGEERLPWLD